MGSDGHVLTLSFSNDSTVDITIQGMAGEQFVGLNAMILRASHIVHQLAHHYHKKPDGGEGS